MSQSPDMAVIRNRLNDRRRDLRSLLEALRSDRMRVREPLSADAVDRAQQCENDQVVDAIDGSAQAELRQVDAALQRIALGTYGACRRCGARISTARLNSIPHADTCSACALRSPPER